MGHFKAMLCRVRKSREAWVEEPRLCEYSWAFEVRLRLRLAIERNELDKLRSLIFVYVTIDVCLSIAKELRSIDTQKEKRPKT